MHELEQIIVKYYKESFCESLTTLRWSAEVLPFFVLKLTCKTRLILNADWPKLRCVLRADFHFAKGLVACKRANEAR
jgi:hypothetical protein